MPILIRCATCAKSLRAAEEHAGREFACPHCGKRGMIQGPVVPPFDVFVSYSSKDKTIADAVVATLEGKGLRCWVAPRDIVPGKEWSEAIIDGINESRMMVLVFSAHANNSQQVLREVERAVNRAMPIVPFRIEDERPSRSMEYFISTHHWLDAYYPPLDAHLEKLAATAESLLSGTAISTKEEPKDSRGLIRAAVKTLLARDNRPRVLVGLVLLLLLVGGLVVWAITALKDPKASPEVIQAKADAEVLFDDLKKLKPGPGIDAKLRELDNELRAAQGHYEHKDFKAAAAAFQRVLDEGPALRDIDRQRTEASAAETELAKPREEAEKAQASRFAPGPWAEANQKTNEGKKGFETGDYALALARYQEAAQAYRRSVPAARVSGKARVKALAFWAGYASQLRKQSVWADGVLKREKLLPDAFEELQQQAAFSSSIAANVCEPELKTDLIRRFREERDLDRLDEIVGRQLPDWLAATHGAEAYSSYWFGSGLAYLYFAGFNPTRTNDFRPTVPDVWRYAYSAGCPEEVTGPLAQAKKYTEVEEKVQMGKFEGDVRLIPPACHNRFYEPMRKRYLKDADTATETFRKPRALPPLPAEQQEAIRTLSEAGGDFSYDGDPLRPELLRFYPHTSGTLRVMPLVCRLPSLRWIFLSAQNVTDEDLAELRGRKGLKRLVLYRTHVTDAGLVHLVGLTDLEELSFSYLPITDQGLEHLTGLRNLKVLWLQNTQVTPAGIERLKAALPNLEIKR